MISVDDWKRRLVEAPAAFSPAPMWFLNGDLREDELARQLRDFAEHGVMGVILHPRIGIPRELAYLSQRFLELIRFAVEEAGRLGMFVILYDEGMYPSGSAGGLVVKENPAYASRGLRMHRGEAPAAPKRRVLARMALRLQGEDSCLSARLLAEGEEACPGETLVTLTVEDTHGTIRGIHEDEDDGQQHAPASADILNPEAVQCFLRLTHERYYAAMPDDFGTVIRAFFVDEPNPMGRCVPGDFRPWTDGMEAMLPDFGLTLTDLPLLFLNGGERTQAVRLAFDRMISRRLGEAFYAPLQAWCHQHGIALTGHPAHADDIELEQYFDIPGQDLVWRWVAPENGLALEGAESTQAMCAFSSALHRGKKRVANECFGCCGKGGRQWTFSVEDMLFYLNWLFVRGTNTIYPHAFLYADDTPVRYGDRPPDVGPHNIWWPRYGKIARYITSCCAVLNAGQPHIRVAILTAETDLPWRFAKVLFQHQVEFAYLERALMREATVEDGCLYIASQRYEALVYEDEGLLDEALWEIMREFSRQGGLLLPATSPKACLDGVELLCQRGFRTVTPDRDAENVRVLTRWQEGGCLLCVSNEGEDDWQGMLTLPTVGYCERLNPWEGTIIPQAVQDGRIQLKLHRRELLFFTVDETRPALCESPQAQTALQAMPLTEEWRATWPEGEMQLACLSDWQTWPGMSLYSGCVRYETRFSLEALPASLLLDLGEVHELAAVTVNGCKVSALLKAPYRCDVTSYVHLGENSLMVEVTNSLASRYDHQPYSSGLIGPVVLLSCTRAPV